MPKGENKGQKPFSAFQLIQAYFWRWGIEVNFKEEKQLFGAGQAQVRSASSVSTAPAVCITTYAALLLAGIRAYGFHSNPDLDRAAYRQKHATPHLEKIKGIQDAERPRQLPQSDQLHP
ncbi:MAG: hypothetical protein ABFR33_11440 [Verrucomicrobiota bacterium]